MKHIIAFFRPQTAMEMFPWERKFLRDTKNNIYNQTIDLAYKLGEKI